ncbi:MAG: hypothetical protein ABIS26_00035 [Candidatus Paceibacterota bacterium]
MTRFGTAVTTIGILLIALLGYFFFVVPKAPPVEAPINIPISNLENPAPVTPGDSTVTNPPSTGTPTVASGCYVGGCSGEICSDQKDIVSNCIYKEEFACYKTAKCERQSTGKCGWTSTQALNSCINNANSGSRVAAGYLSGHVTIGPFCPVEQVGKPCPPPEGAYTSREAIVYESDGKTEKERMHLDTNGNYKFTLGPGTYYVQIAPAGIGPGEKKAATVKSFETTVVNFDIDTGIR